MNFFFFKWGEIPKQWIDAPQGPRKTRITTTTTSQQESAPTKITPKKEAAKDNPR